MFKLNLKETGRRILSEQMLRLFRKDGEHLETLTHILGDHLDAGLQFLRFLRIADLLQQSTQTQLDAQRIEELVLRDRSEESGIVLNGSLWKMNGKQTVSIVSDK